MMPSSHPRGAPSAGPLADAGTEAAARRRIASIVAPAGPACLASLLASLLALALLALAARPALASPPAQDQEPLRWGVPLRIDDDPSGAAQRDASLFAAAEGSLHAVWVDGRLAPGDALYYARLAPGASQWSADLRVWQAAPDEAIGETAITVDGLGQVHVAWEQGAGRDADIFHALLPAGSRAWSAPHRVNDDPPGAAQAAPALAADPYGTLHLVWEDYRRGGADLWFTARVSSGEWVPNFRFHHGIEGDQRRPALAMAKDGWLHAAWLDSRDGESAVYASVLPPGGQVWWPNARLSRPGGRGGLSAPRLAAGADGRIHALWIEQSGLGSLQRATLAGREGFWGEGREVFRPRFGRLLDASLAAGPGGRVMAAWRESREDVEGSRIYAGQLPESGPIVAGRVDGSRLVSQGRQPLAAMDALARLHVAWLARERDDPSSLVHASVDLPAPNYSGESLQGRLEYLPRRFNCGVEGYLLRDCDGQERGFVVTRGLDLVPFLGSQVRIEGFRVADQPCDYLVATGVQLVADPCPVDAAVVTGQLTRLGQPVEGALLWVGERATLTGVSGRYYLDGLPRGAQSVTATLGCGLVSSLGEPDLRRGLNRLPTGALVPGDIVRDCRIDLRDIARVAGQLKREPPFDPDCADLDGDGRMGLGDLAIVAARYGQGCPSAWQGDALGATVQAGAPAAAGPGSVRELPLGASPPRGDGIDRHAGLRAGRAASGPALLLIRPTAPRPVAALRLELPARAAEPVTRSRPEDTAPPPFGQPQPGSWIVVDNARQDDRWVLVAARLSTPSPPLLASELEIRVPIPWLPPAASLLPRSGPGEARWPLEARIELYDAKGQRLPGSVELARSRGEDPPGPGCCWLPWLGLRSLDILPPR